MNLDNNTPRKDDNCGRFVELTYIYPTEENTVNVVTKAEDLRNKNQKAVYNQMLEDYKTLLSYTLSQFIFQTTFPFLLPQIDKIDDNYMNILSSYYINQFERGIEGKLKNDNINTSKFDNNASDANIVNANYTNYSEIMQNQKNNQAIKIQQKINAKETQNKQEEMSNIQKVTKENSNKRKHENFETTITAVKLKRTKTCKSIKSRYPHGERIDVNMKVTNEEEIKYREFMNNSNNSRECHYCKRIINKLDALIVDGTYICCEICAKNEFNLNRLKFDIAENENFEGLKLYKCQRLEHARPLYYFIKFSKRENKYRFVTNCKYCRLYKAVEYAKLKNNKK